MRRQSAAIRQQSLTQGAITGSLLRFALPMMAGNLLQQLYNVADTLVVGRFLGADALAAVGSSYTLMTFITSILLGLCMGSSAVFSLRFGEKDSERLKASALLSFVLIAGVALVLNAAAFLGLDGIIFLLQVPESVVPYMRDYLFVIFMGIGATFLYNYFACLLRAVGNSAVPLLFLGVSALLNVGLDLLFILAFSWGVAGAAIATVIAQFVSGIGLAAYTLLAFPALRPARRHIRWDRALFREIAGYSFLTCVQQSIMNFGILLVQGRVNSFGPTVMAAFAAAVKIDSFAYMPVQDFGNAFSTFVAQNYGAGQPERIRRGARSAGGMALLFCLAVSAVVCLFARPLMTIFISPEETAVIEEGVRYLWVEGSCYVGIGLLFLLYGFYRAVKRPGMSVVLTVLSLGTRVILAYALSAIPAVGVVGIWVSVPIGWLLADAAGIGYYLLRRGRLLPPKSEEAGAA